jgi:hypothetical protein
MELRERLSSLCRGKTAYPLASLLLLAPCYWQPRLQAGDLSSHIYNAWLAQLIESGRAQGLTVVRQTTNVLFDLILSGLFRLFGAEAAQRIAVSLAVLVFIWGCFAFITRVSGRKPWHLMPCIAMLAYGWVFHMGFFNFYLSLGLCFWALAIGWNLSRRRLLLASPVLVLAYVAHALPVAWVGGLMLYLYLARRMSGWQRGLLSAGAVGSMVLLHMVLGGLMLTRWSPAQLTVVTGLDQVWVFDGKYYLVLMGLTAVWGLMFLGLVRSRGVREVVGSIQFQLCLISAAAVFVLPGTVLIPGFLHSLSYIAERMSLGVAICVCAMLGAVQPRWLERSALGLVALIFFGFIYRDERALNAFEDRMQNVVSTLPPGRPVISPIVDFDMRVNALTHMVDRVCIGHCYSYANYEPSTGQFRIRAVERNGIVASTYADSWHLQTGEYVATKYDPPLYKIKVDAAGRVFIETVKAGSPCGRTSWKTLQTMLPNS